MRNRIEVMHGVNLDMLERRPPGPYGGISFDRLEQQIGAFAAELDLEPRFFHSNHEGEFVEHLHRLDGLADGIVMNPGAWTHNAWAIRDALEIAAQPCVEVHLSDIMAREEWRRHSVVSDVCVASVYGQGVEGYREALARLKSELSA